MWARSQSKYYILTEHHFHLISSDCSNSQYCSNSQNYSFGIWLYVSVAFLYEPKEFTNKQFLKNFRNVHAMRHTTCHMHHLVLKTNKMLIAFVEPRKLSFIWWTRSSKLNSFNELNCCKSLQRYSLSKETFNLYFFVVIIAMDEW